jgi:ectoine hydroxylase-related dioxygenase (phytanoyl-CoA dioxygenase family)
MLTREQIGEYASAGYLRFGKLIDDHQLASLREEYDREIKRGRREGHLTNLAATDDGSDAGGSMGKLGNDFRQGDQMLQVYGVSSLNIWFHRLAFYDPLLDIVEDLIGPDIQLLHAHLLYKPPANGSLVQWHHDNTFHQCSPPNMVTAWLTLDDADATNGAMRVIPASHLDPPAEEANGQLSGNEVNTSCAKTMDLRAGEVMFHHCQLVHASGPNRSQRPRRAVVVRFVPIGTRSPHLDTKTWRFFVHPILRMTI